jgi:hypothetical protein
MRQQKRDKSMSLQQGKVVITFPVFFLRCFVIPAASFELPACLCA